MAHILIAEDDRHTLDGLSELLTDEGHFVTGVSNGQQAVDLVQQQKFDVLLTDMKMPRINGMELIKKVHAVSPETHIIMMTAFATVETAVKAMRDGAYSYLTKPVDFGELLATLGGALNETALPARSGGGQTISAPEPVIIGNSPKIREIFDRIDRVARANATVLIRGESGTGKELVARAIHSRSLRADKTMVDVSCASIPENLLESELFGTEKGAYTGALSTTRKGYFERADGGTIFLDEIGEISPSVQVKLLRVLQERRFERLGGTRPLTVDVRVIAATNRDLEEAVRTGRYRQDLFYRLNVIPIVVSPLRERREDIPALIDYFIGKYCHENGMDIKRMTDEALALCRDHDWPGNVRELENAIESAVVISEGDLIRAEDLINLPSTGIAFEVPEDDALLTLADTKGLAEKALLQKTLEEVGGNRTKAARLLGVTVRTIHYKLKRYGLQ
ncbi:MAG: sigma-54-dependent Fis family transcriptional regulator [candidate division Zixibacteria bacterium]|nr:sigma-54-dependent Fis family transcriptional regulator [candidate division Zixibacteria bacterium]